MRTSLFALHPHNWGALQSPRRQIFSLALLLHVIYLLLLTCTVNKYGFQLQSIQQSYMAGADDAVVETRRQQNTESSSSAVFKTNSSANEDLEVQPKGGRQN